MVKKYQANKKRVKKVVVNGHAHVNSTFNNTVVTFSDEQGNTLCWSTSGANGFKGSRKSTPYAAQLAADTAAKKALDFGVKNVAVFVKGPGAGRESALRAISAAGINVTMIKDITPIPHNGCRPKKKRRV